jgi:hypothetical protein
MHKYYIHVLFEAWSVNGGVNILRGENAQG